MLGTIDLLGASDSDLFKGKLLNSAKICGETLLHLIGNVLDASKISEGKMELSITPGDLRERIENVTNMSTYLAQKKNLFIKPVIDKNLPNCLKFDSNKIAQILTNLVSNAVKFTVKGGIFIKVTWELLPNASADIKSVIQEILKISDRKEMIYYIDEEFTVNSLHTLSSPSSIAKYRFPHLPSIRNN